MNACKYLSYAKNIAELSDYRRVHMGCIAVLGNKILSVGYNTTKTHPLQAHYNRLRGFKDDLCNHGLHAEIACLLPLRGSEIAFDKLKLYIYRLRCDGGYGMARPCKGCMAFIKSCGIHDIYYTTDDGYAYERVYE